MKRILLLSAAGLLAALPAQAQPAPYAPCPSMPMSPERRAEYQALQEQARPREALLDSMRTDVVEAARRAGVREPDGLVMLVRDRGRIEVRTHASNVRASVLREAMARWEPRIATFPAVETVVHFRIVPVPIPEPDSMMSGCEPRPLNAERFRREMDELLEREELVLRGTPSVVALITREGEVGYAKVGRSSGWPAADNAMLRAVRVLRFVPASVLGVPVDAWVEIPLIR